MYPKILQIATSLINVIGTIYAVLSILRLTPKDIFSVVTLEGIDNSDKSLLTQKIQARTGIGLIVIGWSFQTLFEFLPINSCLMFIICIGSLLGVVALWLVFMHIRNKAFKKKYMEYEKKRRAQAEEAIHADQHTWGVF